MKYVFSHTEGVREREREREREARVVNAFYLYTCTIAISSLGRDILSMFLQFVSNYFSVFINHVRNK